MAMLDVQSSIEGVKGFKVAGVHCGLKKDGKLDFSLVVSESPCAAAGVFTTNQVKAAPVLVDMERIANNPSGIRAVSINTRSANACTGQPGIDNALKTAELVGQALDFPAEAVLVMSTGVIGMQLPMEKIERGVELASQSLGDDWDAIAHAIMTTDTRPKMASINVETVSGQQFRIAGICKGAGMIAPNMATMLSVVVTDALLTVDEAQSILSAVADVTYNCIVVDGDTSTNDTVLLLANGASGIGLETEEDRQNFEIGLSE
ncbi:MAG: bifunctional ornithine acetyltransferase/N-acetylglutamate synthase, partial [Burkholderiales bacterium]|nr:bifunctional ornithine acetyltransferase/N-acetylglutamate synthase [Anaerolineae bacterium]